MKNLLDSALEKFSQAEVYKIRVDKTSLHYQNGSLQNLDNDLQSAVCLRVLNDGKLGYAYSRNQLDNYELVRNAGVSLLGNVSAGFTFPHSPLVESLDSYKEEIEKQSTDQLANECFEINSFVKSKTNAEVEIYLEKMVTDIDVINSSETNLKFKSSSYNMLTVLIYPGSGWGIEFKVNDKMFHPADLQELEQVIEQYKSGINLVKPDGGEMQVLFMPGSLYTLTWRLGSGTNAQSHFQKYSPIAGKEDIRIFDSKLTIYTDPLDDDHPGCRPFDDEGVVCRRHFLFKNGIFVKRYNDLMYAAKMSEKPTGHGFKETLTSQPSASLHHLRITPGHTSTTEMISGMKKGIILEGVLGAHSGNIPNGDFSVGVNPALYVENGKVRGRIKDAMVSGNVYKILKNIDAVEDKLHPAYGGMLPAMLIDNVNVAI